MIAFRPGSLEHAMSVWDAKRHHQIRLRSLSAECAVADWADRDFGVCLHLVELVQVEKHGRRLVGAIGHDANKGNANGDIDHKALRRHHGHVRASLYLLLDCLCETFRAVAIWAEATT